MDSLLQSKEETWPRGGAASPAETELAADVRLDSCPSFQGGEGRPILSLLIQKDRDSVPELSLQADLSRRTAHRVHVEGLGLNHARPEVGQPPGAGDPTIGGIAIAVFVDPVQ